MRNLIKVITNFLRKILGIILFPFNRLVSRLLSTERTASLKAALATPEIQKRILFTIFLLLVFRILASIPLPGINTEVYQAVTSANTGNAFTNILTLATGSRIDTPSLVVIGLGSYINASIIVQLLTSVIPRLEELQKEGASGRRLLSQITRILTVPLSAMQGFFIFTYIKGNTAQVTAESGDIFFVSQLVSDMGAKEVALMILAIIAGSILLMWIGELITENGIGNGSSIIIMTGILTILPGLFITDFSDIASFISSELSSGNFSVLLGGDMIFVYLFIIGFLVLIAGIVFINEATRKVTIQYARRVRSTGASQSSFLPLKINQAGVMPIIFASSFLTFPTIIANLIVGTAEEGTSLYKIGETINNSPIFNANNPQPAYFILFFVLIIVFTYVYSFIVMKPGDTADNLKKSGGFIPGIRPGDSTAKYITTVMLRLTFVGSFFLAFIALLPNLVRLTERGSQMTIFVGIGGTSILIIVGVILDTMRQMKSLTVTRSYEMYR
jgi:preprotein translocase subunit SecY